MGFETQEEAEAWAENMEFRADQKKEERMDNDLAAIYANVRNKALNDGLELGADMCIRMARSESLVAHDEKASILEAAAFAIRALITQEAT